ncbi:hypothetical protein OHAE_2479 [Ochrobactrum soli]|uniref:Uncharacterized protein n=1 Tax=Ochrobactrum soli TaxID=2448455 RepID=A0A2P9HRC4_9HYPH|nr:hypothetical protein OHAE_2479 [[Ochrobactrum] soli]
MVIAVVMIMVVTSATSVIMVVRMRVRLGRIGALFGGQPFCAIAEAAHFLFYIFGFAAAVM